MRSLSSDTLGLITILFFAAHLMTIHVSFISAINVEHSALIEHLFMLLKSQNVHVTDHILEKLNMLKLSVILLIVWINWTYASVSQSNVLNKIKSFSLLTNVFQAVRSSVQPTKVGQLSVGNANNGELDHTENELRPSQVCRNC